jgi:hypothetical protein
MVCVWYTDWPRLEIAQSTKSLAASAWGARLTTPIRAGVAGRPSAGATKSMSAPFSLKRV